LLSLCAPARGSAIDRRAELAIVHAGAESLARADIPCRAHQPAVGPHGARVAAGEDGEWADGAEAGFQGAEAMAGSLQWQHAGSGEGGLAGFDGGGGEAGSGGPLEAPGGQFNPLATARDG